MIHCPIGKDCFIRSAPRSGCYFANVINISNGQGLGICTMASGPKRFIAQIRAEPKTLASYIRNRRNVRKADIREANCLGHRAARALNDAAAQFEIGGRAAQQIGGNRKDALPQLSARAVDRRLRCRSAAL